MNNSENDNTAISRIICEEYNDQIRYSLENDDEAVNQVEGNINAPEGRTETFKPGFHRLLSVILLEPKLVVEV
ncbi:Hypothetical predicted protein [Octopus vulgaris]|uniref:Uncharacterized protein n=1 Tax=Octopus vulgaris TaxID=6645 RepID=A0AA36FC77_OCTVU|nr:Hypothetical predicted protein [Octopus vulgaris]